MAAGGAADARIKAMVVYKPSFDYSLDDAGRIAIPYLVMGGSQSQFGLAVPALFAGVASNLRHESQRHAP